MEGEALDTKSTHNSNAQLSEKYSPLRKCSKRLFHLYIGCSESKVIFKGRKNNKNNIKKKRKKKALQTSTRSKRSHLEHFTSNHSQQAQSTRPVITKARLEPAIRNAQKLAQNVFPLWTFRGRPKAEATSDEAWVTIKTWQKPETHVKSLWHPG